MRTLLLGVSLALSACASGRPMPTSAKPHCEKGEVATLGVEPSRTLMLNQDGVKRLELTGNSVARIQRLVGTVVRACGAMDSAGRLHVASYELLEVDGMKAYLGILRVRETGAFLERSHSESAVRLADVPNELSANVDHEVWVAGEWRADAFSVRAFGVLHAPERNRSPAS